MKLSIKFYSPDFWAGKAKYVLLLTFLLRIVAGNATDMTVDMTKKAGPIKKIELGNLFGVSSIAGGISDKTLLSQGISLVSSSMGRPGENASNPYSTDAVAPIIRGTGVKMICRFNDLLYGFPYNYTTLQNWLYLVDYATHTVSDNYKDVVLCIAPFNEPDNKFQGSFMSDTALPAGTYDEKVNWLWTQTVRKIRSIDPSIPVMGPNYEFYRPWDASTGDQDRMRNFLINAINTNTVPDIIGWHSLGPSPGDVPFGLSSYYRQLEQELNLPGAPLKIIVEEFGSGAQNDFEGVPGSVMRYVADYTRYGVDFACMGIYTNGSKLGNTTRYEFTSDQRASAGWHLFNWYKSLTGDYVPCSRWDTRHYLSFDGVAAYDETQKQLTVLVGGDNDNANIKILGASSYFGSKVRVRLETAIWEVFSNEPNALVHNGGDPQVNTFNLFDKTFTVDGSGTLTVPINHMYKYNAYRIVVTPVAAADTYPTKYEAENAKVNHVATYANTLYTSGNGYIGGINYSDSYVEFSVNAPARGIYVMNTRYASNVSGGGATHNISVNGESQGVITYDSATAGWSNAELRIQAKRVVLREGANTIRFAKGNSYAELDFIDVRPETHRYEAENALVNDAKRATSHYIPNYVGGINNADSYVEFNLETPRTGNYRLLVGYANGTGGTSTHIVTINGQSSGSISYAPTGGWMADSRTLQKNTSIASTQLTMKAGFNKVRLAKGNGYAELDYVILTFDEDCNGVSAGTAFRDSCGICAGGTTGITPIRVSARCAPLPVPGKIEAEAYSDSSGIASQATTDAGGGRNIGWIENGDWANYYVQVAASTRYLIRYRIASAGISGSIDLYQNDQKVRTTTIPVTGGWQTWQTIVDTVGLTQGTGTLKLVFAGDTGSSLFNINWFDVENFTDCNGDNGGYAFVDSCGICAGGNTGITPVTDKNQCTITGITGSSNTSVSFFPNPFSESLSVKASPGSYVQLFDLSGIKVYETHDLSGDIHPGVLPGTYLLKVISGEKVFTGLVTSL